jgi:hypothetical protein
LDGKARVLPTDWSTVDPNFGHAPGIETITPDKWYPVYPVRINPPRRPFWFGWSVVDPWQLTRPETPKLDRWTAIHPHRLDRAKRPFWAGISIVDPVGLARAEAVSLDRWYSEPQRPRWDRSRRQWLYPAFFADANLATAPIALPPAHRIFRELVSGASDLLKPTTGGNPDTFRELVTGTGRTFK